MLFVNNVYGQIPVRQVHRDIPLSRYLPDYKQLNVNSLDSIKSVLYAVLKYKNIDSLRINGRDRYEQYPIAWHILMRMAEMDWNNKKYEAIDLLHDFSRQILSGKSYMNLNDLNQAQDINISKSDTAFFPFYAYWVMLEVDCDYSLQYVGAMLNADNAVLGSNIYQKKFNSTLAFFLEKHFKSDEVIRFCSKNSVKLGLDSATLAELEKKNAVTHLKSQALIWDYFINNYRIRPIDNESISTWYKNLLVLYRIHPNPDINTLLAKINDNKDYEETYYLLYSLCFAINGELSTQKEKANIEITATNALRLVEDYYAKYGEKLKLKREFDDLKAAYDVLKYSLSKKN